MPEVAEPAVAAEDPEAEAEAGEEEEEDALADEDSAPEVRGSIIDASPAKPGFLCWSHEHHQRMHWLISSGPRGHPAGHTP